MPVAPAARLSSSRTLTSTRELGFGDSGAAVTELQQLLQRAGVPTGPIDGDFGQMTQAAVRRFQASRGLPVDGIAGELTFGALRRTSTPTAPGGPSQPLRQGDFGADVQKLQRSLARHGFFTDVDGQFGSDTRAKVVQFQRAKGLNADGVVNAATWRALESAPAARQRPRSVFFAQRGASLGEARARRRFDEHPERARALHEWPDRMPPLGE